MKAEQDLATVACQYRPDELQRYAVHYALVLNPDGSFSDRDRARRRGITVGPQGFDGMSRISGYLTPEARRLGGGVGQVGRPGHVQPGRRHADGGGRAVR